MNIDTSIPDYFPIENRFDFNIEHETFGKHFSASAKKFEKKVALIHNNQSISYKKLDELSNQVANYLINSGLGPNQLVGVFYERNINYIVLMLGTIKAGATYVPIDPSYPTDRIEYMIENSGVSLVLSSDKLQEKIIHLDCEINAFDTELTKTKSSSIESPDITPRATDLMYVVYTSGSTGAPKGVMIEHHSALNLAYTHQHRAYSQACSLDERSSCLITPFAFDVSIEHILTLLFGHTLHIINNNISLDPEALMNYIQDNKVNILCVSPSYIVQLIDAGYFDKGKSLSLTVLGGEMIGESLWEKLATSNQTFYNFYGPTEGTIDTSGIEITDRLIPNTVGTALSNTNMYILDDQLKFSKIGTVGEICISGIGIARGYINNQELTAEKFISNPYSSSIHDTRLYRTGDMGRYLENGYIEILGRKDSQVKIRGYRIELGEIEAVLRRHDEVEDASIVTKVLDDQSKRIFGYVILKQNKNLSEIIEYLKEILPSYMIPTRLFQVNSFPLTQNGKIDKSKLMHNLKDFKDTSQVVPPLNITTPQEFIKKMWAEIFFEESIPIDVSFFKLGGDSLLAMKVVSKCAKMFGIKLSIKEFNDNSSINSLSALIKIKKCI